MINLYRSILKLTAAAGVFCGLYPAVMSLRGLFYPDLNAPILADLAFYAAVFALGVVVTSMAVANPSFFSHPASLLFPKRDNTATSLRLAAVSCCLLVFPVLAVTRFVYLGAPDLRHLFECAAVFPVFIVAVRCGRHPYDTLLNLTYIVADSIILILAALLCWGTGGAVLHTFPAFMGIFLFTAMLTSNQSGMERYVSSKRHMESLLPGNVRRRGAAAVLFVFILILCVSVFRRKIAGALSFLIRVIVRAVVAALSWLSSLLAYLLPTSGTDAGLPVFPQGNDSGEGNPILNVISLVLAIAIIAYVIYRLLPKLPPFLREQWQKLLAFLRGISSDRTREKAAATGGDFHDEIERLDFDGAAHKTGWRASKRLSKLKDPSARMRLTYKLAIQAINRQIRLKPSDTTGQINQAVSGVAGLESPARELTALYEPTRYNNAVPDEETLEQARRHMLSIRKRVKPADRTKPKKITRSRNL